MEPAPRNAPLAACCAAAAALSAGLGVESALNFGTRTDGVLGLALPWVGALLYAVLAGLAWRRAASPWLAQGVGFAVFVHASLLAESLLAGRLCWLCVAVGVLALAAAAAQVARRRADGVTLALSLVLGAASGFFEPFDRVDGALTR